MTADLMALTVYEEPTAEELLAQFDEHLDSLAKALESTKDARRMADSFKSKGAFTLFFDSMTGTGQKDLAGMIRLLATNLGTTQLALELVMKLQIRKNGVLRDFHDALARKIASVVADTTTLDQNQREAAVLILSELRRHVGEQITFQEMVEGHDADIPLLKEESLQTQTLLSQLEAVTTSELAWTREALRQTDQRIQDLFVLHAETVSRVAELERAMRRMTVGWGAVVRYAAPVSVLISAVALALVWL